MTTQPPVPSVNNPDHQGGLKKPTLLIFDDDMNHLALFMDQYEGHGFNVIGIPVVGANCVQADAALTEGYKQQIGHIFLEAPTHGVANADHLLEVLKKFKPQAILVDGQLVGNACFNQDRDPKTGDGRGLIAEAQRICPGIPAVLHTNSDAFYDERGAPITPRPHIIHKVPVFAKNDDKKQVAAHLHMLIQERPKGFGFVG